MKPPLSSPAEETTIPATKLPIKLDCVKCGCSVHKEGGYILSMATVVRPDEKCVALCNSCGDGEAK